MIDPHIGENSVALVKTDETKSVVLSSDGSAVHKPLKKKKILEEEDYDECITKIIERDYFPDLKKLKAQSEYLEAKQSGDVAKVAQIAQKYAPTPVPGSNPLATARSQSHTVTPYNIRTPATFETPGATSRFGDDDDWEEVDREAERDGTETVERKRQRENKGNNQVNEDGLSEKPSVNKLNLNNFLSKHSSEDNASFVEIMETAERKRREKLVWLYEKAGQQQQLEDAQLALPSIEEQAAIEGNLTKLQTWTYRPANALMYNLEGAPLTPEEAIALSAKKQEINRDGTRFNSDPFKVPAVPKSAPQTQYKLSNNVPGRVDHSGNEIGPTVSGYSFVSTPSPSTTPLHSSGTSLTAASPLMTWGELEGEPFLLDASDQPVAASGGSSRGFKLNEESKRDKIGRQLAENVAKQHRDKKSQAVSRMKSNMNSPNLSRTERLAGLSPAAQRLASARGVHLSTDRALRASYTPQRSSRGVTTPLYNPGLSTPSTPTYNQGLSTPSTPIYNQGISTPTTPGTPDSLRRDKMTIKVAGSLVKKAKKSSKSSRF